MVEEEAEWVEGEVGEQRVDVHWLRDKGGTKTVKQGEEREGEGGSGLRGRGEKWKIEGEGERGGKGQGEGQEVRGLADGDLYTLAGVGGL